MEVTKSVHGMNCVEICNPTKEQREIILEVIYDPYDVSDIRYKSGAFLQCNTSDYILIEFWLNDYQEFVDYLNKKLDSIIK